MSDVDLCARALSTLLGSLATRVCKGKCESSAWFESSCGARRTAGHLWLPSTAGGALESVWLYSTLPMPENKPASQAHQVAPLVLEVDRRALRQQLADASHLRSSRGAGAGMQHQQSARA